MKTVAHKNGFSLVEVMITAVVLGVTIVGILQLFVYCRALSEISGKLTIAVSEAHGWIEQIRDHSYDLIDDDYGPAGTPGDIFFLNNITGTGKIYVNSDDPDLLQIDIVVSWQNDDGRIVGEDLDLEGDLDGGEDFDGNGRLSSIATVSTKVAKK